MRISPRPAAYSKSAKTHANPLIRIDTPSTKYQTEHYDSHRADNVHQMLHGEIEQVKKRVIRSKIVLQDSRRQQSSPEKLVESDRMGLVFNHPDSANKTMYQKLYPEGKLQREDQTHQEQSQGKIQLPFHMNDVADMRHTLSTAPHFQQLNSSRGYFNRKPKQKKANILILQDFRRQQSKDKESKVKLTAKDQRTKLSDEATRHLNARKYKELFGRSKDLIKYKENFNKSLEDKQSHNFKTEKYFLNLSQERLAIYLPQERSLSKQRRVKIKTAINLNSDKKIVTVNNPNFHQTSRNGQTKQFNLKPRYQIVVPEESKKINSHDTELKLQRQRQETEWQELKQKVERYEFVRKHLKGSDLFMIYEYLKKNQIGQEKWPLFVVEEAYKRMNLSKQY